MKIPTLDMLRSLQTDRLISVRSLDDLIICNYTQRCAYDRKWDDATMICRGLILRLDDVWEQATEIREVVALPFKKFFNVGEGDRYPTEKLVEVTTKEDGVLGILFRHNGGYRIATRGSFDSEQAIWATEFLKRYDLMELPQQYTLLFEIIYSGSKIVVDYQGREDLILLGVTDRYQMGDLPFWKVQHFASKFGFSTPAVWQIDSVEAALKAANDLDFNHEGWVLRFANGERFKVKGDQYKLVHRLIMQISRKHVIEAMCDGTIDDWLERIPDEFRDEVNIWLCEAQNYIKDTYERVNTLFSQSPKGSRKEFALRAKDQREAPYLFSLYDGRDIMPLIYKQLLEDGKDG